MYMEYSITSLEFNHHTLSKICNKFQLSEAAAPKNQSNPKMESFETNS